MQLDLRCVAGVVYTEEDEIWKRTELEKDLNKNKDNPVPIKGDTAICGIHVIYVDSDLKL